MFWRRHTHRLSRLVVAWFVLSIGAAVASPMVSPHSMVMLCTANGVSLVKVTPGDTANTPDGGTVSGSAAMDCPLCWMPLAGAPAQWQLPEPHLTMGLVASTPGVQVHLSPRYSPPARAPPLI